MQQYHSTYLSFIINHLIINIMKNRSTKRARNARKVCTAIPFQKVIFYQSCDTRWIDKSIATIIGC